jgi:hypothetical protein
MVQGVWSRGVLFAVRKEPEELPVPCRIVPSTTLQVPREEKMFFEEIDP